MKLIIYSAPDSGLAQPVTVNVPVVVLGGGAASQPYDDAALVARVVALEEAPAPASYDDTALSGRVSALEERPASEPYDDADLRTILADLAGRMVALETGAPPAVITVTTDAAAEKVTTGTTLTGSISGAPSGATILHRWTDGTAEYTGATGPSFTPVIGAGGVMDGGTIYYAPTVNGAEHRSTAHMVVRVAPTATGSAPDVTAAQGDPVVIFSAAVYFSGVALSYEVSGSGVSINALTGAVTVTTGAARSAAPVVVTARNSGGSAQIGFSVTIAAPVIGDANVTATEQVDLFQTSPGAPWPWSGTITPPAGATGTLIFVTGQQDWLANVTFNGVVPTLIGAVKGRRRATGAFVQRTSIFYTTETAGTLNVAASGAISYTILVHTLHVTGGTARSFQLLTDDYFPPDANPFTRPYAVQHRSGDMGFLIYEGDNSTVSPISGGVRIATLDAMRGAIYQLPDWTTDATANLSVTGATVRDVYGSAMLVVSQHATPQVQITPARDEGFIYPLNRARTEAVVPVSGTYTGSADGIEIRAVDHLGAGVTPWKAVTGSGGSFVSDLTVTRAQASGKLSLRVEARFAASPGKTFLQPSLWHIGPHYMAMGQSNMGHFLRGTNGGGGPVTTSPFLYYDGSSAGYQPGGRAVNAFAAKHFEMTGLPCFVIGADKAGASIEELSPGTPPFAAALAAVRYTKTPIHGILWHQGEGSSGYTDWKPMSGYFASLNAIRDGLAAEAGSVAADIPIILASLSSYGDGTPTALPVSDWKWSEMQRWLQQAEVHMTNVHYSHSRADCPRVDGFHSTGTTLAVLDAPRFAHSAARIMGFTAAAPKISDFRIAAASATSATQTTVTVSHGLGTGMEIVTIPHGTADYPTGTITTAPDAFEVWDGSAWIKAPATITDGTMITLTHAGIPTAGRKLRYLFGLDAGRNGLIRDTSAYHAPLPHVMEMGVVPG